MTDPFPPSEFDQWAETYDQATQTSSVFPFAGYEQVLETVVREAGARPGMTVLDIGTGTGNLALRFAGLGCELWCTDFSESMLEKARVKLPGAHFVLHDFRTDLPPELKEKRFDAIVSAYVFHHLDLTGKVQLCQALAAQNLAPDGKLVIADLSFQNRAAMDAFAASVLELWDEEPYWLVEEAIPALEHTGLKVVYIQVSICAGVYAIQP